MDRPRSGIVDDQPTAIDTLGFAPYVEALSNIVAGQGTRTPLVVGVFGKWGSGKTSLMRQIETKITEAQRTDWQHAKVVWFDAWKYEREDALWRALLVQVLATLRREAQAVIESETATKQAKETATALEAELNTLEEQLYRTVTEEEAGNVHLDWGEAIKTGGKAAFRLGLNFIPGAGVLAGLLNEGATDDMNALFGAINQERRTLYRQRIESLEQFQQAFGKLVATHIVGQDQRLVVFVDDLDRCLPEKAIEVLEAIKLFMDVRGCVFVLGLDRDVVTQGIDAKYRSQTPEASQEQQRAFGSQYLEKIVQVPFRLPAIEPEVMTDFVHGQLTEWPDDRCVEVFARGMRDSPRRVKRTLNTFLLLWGIAKAQKAIAIITPVRLAKLVAIQQIAPGLYELLRENRRLIRTLEVYYSGRTAVEPSRDEPIPELPPLLEPYARCYPLLQEVLTTCYEDEDTRFQTLDFEDLNRYFTLTRRSEAPQATEAEAWERAVFEPETIRIPEGPFLMGSTDDELAQVFGEAVPDWVRDEQPQHEVFLSTYRIGRYPITNQEYHAFVEATNHAAPRHWKEGTYPEGQGDHPVVYVSWEDARDYCAWLTEAIATEGVTYQLPTEAQWEKAARGTDARIYPWGDTWDPNKVNSEEAGPSRRTAVGAYAPDGDSPYGLSDMTGNAWEWCADWYSQYTYRDRDEETVENPTGPPEGTRLVLRGAAFLSDDGYVRCATRYDLLPSGRFDGVGFRVVAQSSSNR